MIMIQVHEFYVLKNQLSLSFLKKMIEIIMNVNICKISEDINNWKWYAVFNTCKTHMAFKKKELNLVLSEVFVIEGNHHLHKFLKSNVC